jgi:hypothetical protein
MRRTHSGFLQLLSAVLLTGLFFIAPTVLASSGFVTSPIWLIPESPKEGEMATLSAAFRNEDTETISGTILFYDKEVLLARKSITIPPKEVGTASVAFVVSAGDHSFSASMNTVNRLKKAGGIDVVNVPASTVKLPGQFVSKKIGVAAQAGNQAASSSEQPILNQIDSAEKKVLDVIPENLKEKVSVLADTVDTWRVGRAAVFSDGVLDAKLVLAKQAKTKEITANTVLGSKKVTVKETPKNYTDGPLAYLKLWTYTVFGYIFGTALFFYVIGALFTYLILRFIFRKIARGFGRGKKTSSKERKESR